MELALRLRGEACSQKLPATHKPLKAVKQLKDYSASQKTCHIMSHRWKFAEDKKETVAELAQWLKKIGLKAYPAERAPTRYRILLDAFVRALPDEQQRCYIWDKEPKGLEDAVSAALRYEGICHTED